MKSKKYYISTLSASTYGAKGLDCKETKYDDLPFFEGSVDGLKSFVANELLPQSEDMSYEEVPPSAYMDSSDPLVGVQVEFWHCEPTTDSGDIPKEKLAWLVAHVAREN